jgi:hypothetical protein
VYAKLVSRITTGGFICMIGDCIVKKTFRNKANGEDKQQQRSKDFLYGRFLRQWLVFLSLLYFSRD